MQWFESWKRAASSEGQGRHAVAVAVRLAARSVGEGPVASHRGEGASQANERLRVVRPV